MAQGNPSTGETKTGGSLGFAGQSPDQLARWVQSENPSQKVQREQQKLAPDLVLWPPSSPHDHTNTYTHITQLSKQLIFIN